MMVLDLFLHLEVETPPQTDVNTDDDTGPSTGRRPCRVPSRQQMMAQFAYCAREMNPLGVSYSGSTVTVVALGPTTTVLLTITLQAGSIFVPNALLSDDIQNFMLNFIKFLCIGLVCSYYRYSTSMIQQSIFSQGC